MGNNKETVECLFCKSRLWIIFINMIQCYRCGIKYECKVSDDIKYIEGSSPSEKEIYNIKDDDNVRGKIDADTNGK